MSLPGLPGLQRRVVKLGWEEQGLKMIVVAALLGFTVLYSMFVVVPITTHHSATPLGFIVVLGGFIFGWFAIIGISVNVHIHGFRGTVIKKGFLEGMGFLKFWLTCMGVLLAVGIVLALTGH
jgi:hypothetical protein